MLAAGIPVDAVLRIWALRSRHAERERILALEAERAHATARKAFLRLMWAIWLVNRGVFSEELTEERRAA